MSTVTNVAEKLGLSAESVRLLGGAEEELRKFLDEATPGALRLIQAAVLGGAGEDEVMDALLAERPLRRAGWHARKAKGLLEAALQERRDARELLRVAKAIGGILLEAAAKMALAELKDM